MRLSALAGILAALTIILLSSCSRIDLAYRWMDHAVANKVGDALDLTRAQREAVEEMVGREKRRMIRTWGARYAAELRSLSLTIRRPSLTGPELKAEYEKGAALIRKSASDLEEPVVGLLHTLSTEQRTHFLERAQDRQKKAAKDLDSLEARRKEQKRRLSEWFDLLGVDRDDPQDALLEQFVNESPFPFELESKSRVASLKRLESAFADQTKLQAYLHELFTEPEKSRTVEYARAYTKYFTDAAAFETKLFHSLNQKQRSRIEKRLADYASQLEALTEKESALHP